MCARARARRDDASSSCPRNLWMREFSVRQVSSSVRGNRFEAARTASTKTKRPVRDLFSILKAIKLRASLGTQTELARCARARAILLGWVRPWPGLRSSTVARTHTSRNRKGIIAPNFRVIFLSFQRLFISSFIRFTIGTCRTLSFNETTEQFYKKVFLK